MDVEILGTAAMVAFVLMQVIEAIIKPAWDKAKWDRFYLFYVAIAIGSTVGWWTGLNAFPVFVEAPIVGRVLTVLGMGLGPSFIYNLVDKGQKT